MGYSYRASVAGGTWSAWHEFTPHDYADGPTKIAWYGDMNMAGAWKTNHSSYAKPGANGLPSPMPIGNLLDDVAAGRVHAVLHSGDHCYQFTNDGTRHRLTA